MQRAKRSPEEAALQSSLSDPSRQPYSTLLEINNAIMSNLTQESLFHAISGALRTVVPFDRALLYVAEGNVLRTIALEGRDLEGHSHGTDKEVAPRGTAVGWAFEHRQPRLSHDLAVEARLPGDEILFSGGVRSYLTVPLLSRDRAIGALLLASFEPERYAPAAIPFLEGVARQIALAVENMRAYEEIARLRARLEEENRYLQEEIKTEHNFEEITGQSPAMKQVFKTIQAVAPTDTTVLILGETGTGKELVARAVHNLSTRRHRALVKVNCAALPGGLIESTIHMKAWLTTAVVGLVLGQLVRAARLFHCAPCRSRASGWRSCPT
jgi:formate hydrogenlyase transcriptional activator